MSKESELSPGIQGLYLRERVRQELQITHESLQYVTQNGQNTIIPSILKYLDDMGINWNMPRTTAEIVPIADSLGTAIYYAYIKAKKRDIYLKKIQNNNQTEQDEIIIDLLQDPQMKKVFYENMWRPIITATPQRGIPLQYLLRDEFGEQKNIRGIDLGAGVHIALPLINSTRYLEANFTNKDQLIHLAKPVNLAFCLGVDKQDGRSDLDWVQASTLPTPDDLTQQEQESIFQDQRFPLLTLDFLGINSVNAIKSELEGYNQPHKVDVVLTSFVRQQLGNEYSTQLHLQQLITDLLEEDSSIWIDVGEELLHNTDIASPSIKVYKKSQGKLIVKGKPFILHTRGRGIQQVNLDYFGVS